MAVFTTVISLIGGLGLFLYGMNIMADGLQKSAGGKMKKLLSALTANRFLGVLVGALVTAIIQSSSATTVMVVGFVNAGLINLSQAVGVIMGANIGTTVTSWIVAMGSWTSLLKPEVLAPLAAGIGAMLFVFSKKDGHKRTGEIIIGFGLLFVGLNLMSSAMKEYADSPVFREAFVTLGANPLLGILTGMVVTAVIQSSSASVSILQAVAIAGLVPWNAAVYIILGQNIGTCVTAILSALGAGKNAKRAAAIHLMFNVFGTVLFAAISIIVFTLRPDLGESTITLTGISIFHTVFNIGNTVVMFPMAPLLVKLSQKLIPDRISTTPARAKLLTSLDPRILENPGFAIVTASEQVVKMGDEAVSAVTFCRDAIFEKKPELTKSVYEKENIIDISEAEITDYLVEISDRSLSDGQSHSVNTMLHMINDIERVGDHSENIAEHIDSYYAKGISFSGDAADGLRDMFEQVLSNLRDGLMTYTDYDMELAAIVRVRESRIDALEKSLRSAHMERLMKNECTPDAGVIYLEMLNNLERISDHSVNLVEAAEANRQ